MSLLGILYIIKGVFADIYFYKIRFCKVKTFKQYYNSAKTKYNKEIPNTLNYCPIRYVDDLIAPSLKTRRSNQYVCQIENSIVIGSSNIVITKSGSIIYDFFFLHNENYKITDPGLKYWNNPIRCFNWTFVRYLRRGAFNKEIAINLVNLYSWNYYHYIYEVISKFYYINKCNIPKNIPIIVDDVIKKIPQMLEILSIFSGSRDIIFLKPLCSCKVNLLYCISPVNQIIPNFMEVDKIRNDDTLFNYSALFFMREHFVNYSKCSNKKFPNFIYLSRKNAVRRSYNESELLSIARNHGISVVCPEEYTAMEQFQMFSNAKCIIAASGAALTNIICCPPTCRILVLVSQKIDMTIFSTIAKFFNIDIRYLSGEVDEKNNIQSSFRISPNSFRKIIEGWLLKEEV